MCSILALNNVLLFIAQILPLTCKLLILLKNPDASRYGISLSIERSSKSNLCIYLCIPTQGMCAYRAFCSLSCPSLLKLTPPLHRYQGSDQKLALQHPGQLLINPPFNKRTGLEGEKLTLE